MNTKQMTRMALIAAVYTALSLALAPFSFSNIQVRLAEALTMIPLIYRPGIWGVTLGCFLTNLIGALTGVNPTGFMDAVIGTSATLIAALITWQYRDHKIAKLPLISVLAPVVLNLTFIGAELSWLYTPESFWTGCLIFGLEVAAGELIAVALGYILVTYLKNTGIFAE